MPSQKLTPKAGAMNDCCTIYKVTNNWGPTEMLYYNVGSINGKQYWISGDNAIWYDGDERSIFDWLVGPIVHLGARDQEVAYLASNEHATCPTGVRNWHEGDEYGNSPRSKMFNEIECVRKFAKRPSGPEALTSNINLFVYKSNPENR